MVSTGYHQPVDIIAIVFDQAGMLSCFQPNKLLSYSEHHYNQLHSRDFNIKLASLFFHDDLAVLDTSGH